MSRGLNQLYNDTEHVLKERYGDVNGEEVLKSLQDAMNFLFQPEDSRPDSGFEDRIGRCNIFTPEPPSDPDVDPVGESVHVSGAPVYYNDIRSDLR